jgi:hypothetical protein
MYSVYFSSLYFMHGFALGMAPVLPKDGPEGLKYAAAK